MFFGSFLIKAPVATSRGKYRWLNLICSRLIQKPITSLSTADISEALNW